MSRPERRAQLPGPDVPSPEVLDELLRAFAADDADPERLGRIDLDSKAVQDLITPPGSDPAPTGGERAADAAEEHGADAAGGVEGDGPGAADRRPDVAEVAELGDVVDGAPIEADEPDDVPGDVPGDEPRPEVEVAEVATPRPVVEVDGPAGGADGPSGPAAAAVETAGAGPAAGRTIVIDASEGLNDPLDASELADLSEPTEVPDASAEAGSGAPIDPLLGGAPASREGTIFIDDRQTGETLTLEAATAATRIEPRLRERRIAVRRAEGRKRLRWVAVVVVVVLLVVAALAVLGSSLFAIDEVDVQGAVYADEERVAAVVDDLVGTPVLRADTDAAEAELEAIPWVLDARVTTDFPDRATIELRERTPIAAFQGPDDRWRVIDDDGRVLDVLDSQPLEYLLLVSADPPSSDAGQFAPPGFSGAASMIQALTPELRARAQSVAVTPDGSDLRLLLDDGVEVRFGAARDLVSKLVRLQARLDQIDAGGFSYVDVSTNEVTTG